MYRMYALTATTGLLLLFAGCGGQETDTTASSQTRATLEALPEGLFEQAAPADAAPLAQVRAAAAPGDTVAFHGYIGGRMEPFTEGRAMFLMADSEAAPACQPTTCPTPWDACCIPNKQVAANSATVQVVDESGQLLGVGLNGVSGLAPGTELTVVGEVREANENVFIVDATGLAISVSK